MIDDQRYATQTIAAATAAILFLNHSRDSVDHISRAGSYSNFQSSAA